MMADKLALTLASAEFFQPWLATYFFFISAQKHSVSRLL
jgi:hypothetical protein